MSRYIDADEEIRKINEAISINEQGRKEESLASYCLRRVAEALEKAPTADVEEVRHGKDIYETVLNHHCEFKCSVCGNWIGVVEGGTLDGAIEFKYCPACGAKMDKENGE